MVTSKSSRLTTRQRVFIAEFAKDRNATQAAIRAGYSARTARVTAAKMLSKANISAELEKAIAAHCEAAGVDGQRVIRELGILATANVLDYIRVVDGDAVVDLSVATRDQMAAVQEIVSEIYLEGRGDKAREVKRTRLKIANKVSALDVLARYTLKPMEKSEPTEVTLRVEYGHTARDRLLAKLGGDAGKEDVNGQ